MRIADAIQQPILMQGVYWGHFRWTEDETSRFDGCSPQLDQGCSRGLGRFWHQLSVKHELVHTAALGDSLQLIVRGHVSFSDGAARTTGQTAAERILEHYRSSSTLPTNRLEGSFTIVVLDHIAGRIVMYRNLMGDGNTFYTLRCNEFYFASNLADCLNLSGFQAELNTEVLPLFFLFRYIPGPETLIRGVRRLLPGEQVVFENNRISCTQQQTLGSLRESKHSAEDADSLLGQVMLEIASEHVAEDAQWAGLLSGGVDSSYLQAIWSEANGNHRNKAFVVATAHPMHAEDKNYAISAAKALATDLTVVTAHDAFQHYLVSTISATGETPNHVQACYFQALARDMVAQGSKTGICGEAADAVFGVATTNYLQNAQLFRQVIPVSALRHGMGVLADIFGMKRLRYYVDLADNLNNIEYINHPVNQQAVFADLASVDECFGAKRLESALAYRRKLIADQQVDTDILCYLNASNLLTSSVDSASYWATIFEAEGANLRSPFLDSRVLRFAVNSDTKTRFPFRRPKAILKKALAHRVSPEFAYRHKRGFGQPIFEWLADGGQLRPMVERISKYDFVREDTLARGKRNPNWFLYSLLCFDLWHKLFVLRELPSECNVSIS